MSLPNANFSNKNHWYVIIYADMIHSVEYTAAMLSEIIPNITRKKINKILSSLQKDQRAVVFGGEPEHAEFIFSKILHYEAERNDDGTFLVDIQADILNNSGEIITSLIGV